MSVTVHIPGPLRPFAGGQSQVELEASATTLSEVLRALWIACPGIRDRVLTEQGQIREHINVFVGNEDVRYTGGLATPISPGTEISIVPAVSGGGMVAGPTRAQSPGRRSKPLRNLGLSAVVPGKRPLNGSSVYRSGEG
jgi:molybdopterin converting factor small subunit